MPNGHVVAHRPLMADVARLAGVSIPTVSRALSGDGTVAPSTRARIQTIARSLHYGVDERARGLRLGQNHTVSVVVPKGPHPGPALTDPFYMALLGSIADALADQGHSLLLSCPSGLQPGALAHDIETGRAGGLIIVGQAHDPAPFEALARRGIPFVVWGGQPDAQAYATAGSDDGVGGRLATGHLLDRGARRVVFVGDTRLPEMARRHAGHLQAHRLRGVTPLTETAPPWPDPPADTMALVESWLRRAPAIDAFFAGSDLLAMAVVHSLQRLGRRVPQDIAVVGYGDTALAAQLHPPLTSVGASTAVAGVALVQALQGVIDGGRPTSTLLPTRLQVRQSSAVARRTHGLAGALHG